MYTFKHKLHALIPALLLISLVSGCIKNDIPYPHIQPNFTSFQVVNQQRATVIDSIERTLTVYLNEEADIYNVQVDAFNLNPPGAVWPDSLRFINGADLSSPVDLTVSLYQEYTWRLTAVQTIERYFTFKNQIGASEFDAEAHTVTAMIDARADISAVQVNTIKLGGTSAVMTPDLNGEVADFTSPVEVTVTEFGRETVWTISLSRVEASVYTESVDAWTCVAWVKGSAREGQDNGVEYRRADSDSWERVSSSWIEHDGGSFTARLMHLTPLTQYVARAYSGDDFGDEIAFTTEGTWTIPNGSLDDWWLNGKVWCPWSESGNNENAPFSERPWWDTGNKGATTLGQSNTTPIDDTPTGTGRAARLESKFVGIGSFGKLAAGNLFAGIYVKTEGTNGILSFGRDFSLHPTKVKGFMKYKGVPISHTSKDFTDLKNRPDTAIIWAALIDSPQAYEIRTNPNNRHLFNPDGDEVVAYGQLQWSDEVSDYREFEIEFKYKSHSRKPRYLLIVASASKYGDYFTGGSGSVLCVDDFSLDFDY